MKTAKDFMSTPARTIEISKSILDASKVMKNSKISSLIVTEKNIPKGIITENDVVIKFAVLNKLPSEIEVRKICSLGLISVSPETEMKDVCKMFDKKNIRHIAVIKNDKLIGVLTMGDIMNKIF
jgi:CBS domain-containing protein